MSVSHLCLVHVIIGKDLTVFFLVPSLISLLILLHFLYYIYNSCHLNTYTMAHRSLWTGLCENDLLWPSTLISFFWTLFQWISWDNVAGELAIQFSCYFAYHSQLIQAVSLLSDVHWLCVLWSKAVQSFYVFCASKEWLYCVQNTPSCSLCLLGLLYIFVAGIPQVTGIKWTFYIENCILVLMMVLSVPINHELWDSEYRQVTYTSTWYDALLNAVQEVHRITTFRWSTVTVHSCVTVFFQHSGAVIINHFSWKWWQLSAEKLLLA